MARKHPLIAAIRLAAPAVSILAPALAARWLGVLWATPNRRKMLPREREWMADAERSSVQFAEKIEMPVWTWGQGPTVLLVHGWSGRGSQLAVHAAPLVEAGFRVLTFDMPGHGEAGGRLSALPIFRQAIERIAATTGPLHGIVAHSLGTAAVTCAVARGLQVERLVYLAPAEDLGSYLVKAGRYLGFGDGIAPRSRVYLEKRYDVRFEEARGGSLAPERTTPLLVVHDQKDRDVPWAEGARIAELWPGAQLVTTHGLGHGRIVRDRGIVQRVTDFTAGRKPAAAADAV